MIEPIAAITAAIKLSGAVLGAALALMFQPPNTIMGALRRLAISIPCGLVFYPQFMSWLGWAETPSNEYAAIVACSVVAWWVFGAVVRILEVWKPKQ